VIGQCKRSTDDQFVKSAPGMEEEVPDEL